MKEFIKRRVSANIKDHIVRAAREYTAPQIKDMVHREVNKQIQEHVRLHVMHILKNGDIQIDE